MEEYLRQRQELIARDRALRRDNAPAANFLSDELKADEVLKGIRSAEAKSVWGQQLEVEHMQGPQQMFPGMEFLTGAYRAVFSSHCSSLTFEQLARRSCTRRYSTS